MPPIDDIPLEKPTGSEMEHAVAPKPAAERHEVGAESEVRGGSEAADESLDDTPVQKRTDR